MLNFQTIEHPEYICENPVKESRAFEILKTKFEGDITKITPDALKEEYVRQGGKVIEREARKPVKEKKAKKGRRQKVVEEGE